MVCTKVLSVLYQMRNETTWKTFGLDNLQNFFFLLLHFLHFFFLDVHYALLSLLSLSLQFLSCRNRNTTVLNSEDKHPLHLTGQTYCNSVTIHMKLFFTGKDPSHLHKQSDQKFLESFGEKIKNEEYMENDQGHNKKM